MKRLVAFVNIMFLYGSLLAQVPEISLTSPTSDASLREDIILTSANADLEGLNGEDLRNNNIEPLIILRETDIGGNNVPFTASLSSNRRVINIDPTSLLLPNQTYFIQLDSVRRRGGSQDTLAITTYTFTTGPPASVDNLLTSGLCIGDGTPITLRDIVISEGMADNFIYSVGTADQRSTLELPDGLEFVPDVGTASSAAGDIVISNLFFPPGNRRRVRLTYTLCSTPSPPACTANTALVDEITLSGLQVRMSAGSTLGVGTYQLTRITGAAGGNNNAEMPGLGAGTVFARIQVEEGAALRIVDETSTPIEPGTPATFCMEDEITVGVQMFDGSPLTLGMGDQLSFFVGSDELTSANFTIDGTNITIDTASLAAAGIPLEPGGLNFVARVDRTSGCPSFSTPIVIDTTARTGAQPVITMDGFTQGGQIVPQDNPTEVIANPGPGLLTIRSGTEILFSDPNYLGGFEFNPEDYASDDEQVSIEIRYLLIDNGCLGKTANLNFTILPRPRIFEELGVAPAYCEDDVGSVPINFRPPGLEDATSVADLTITGDGITGSLSGTYDPIDDGSVDYATGFSFDIEAARASLGSGESSIFIDVSYESVRTVPVFDEVCRVEIEFVTQCNPVFGCVPCFPGDPCYIGGGPTPLATTFEVPNEWRSANSVAQSSCAGGCGFNEQCEQIGINCEEVPVEVIVCDIEQVGTTDVTSELSARYTVQFLEVPELEFITVTREPISTVYCVDNGPVLLLGGPGDTFANKRFSLRNLDNNAQTSLTDFSFTPGEGDLLPNANGYRLYFEFEGDISNCPNLDSLDFVIEPIPDIVNFPIDIPRVEGLPIFRYCLGDEVALVNFPAEDDNDLIWRDDRGFALDTSDFFLPPVETDEIGLRRFTAERLNVLGGCVSAATSFFVQVGATPEADYTFDINCGGDAFFTEQAIHAGSRIQNDTIRSFFWNFNDEGVDFISTLESDINHEFSTNGVYDVSMVVETSVGCTDTLTRKVAVFNEIVVDPGTNVYAETFNAGSGGWIATSETDDANGVARNSSWRIAEVFGQPAWVTSNNSTGTFNNNEFSWVESPCINLNQWTDPVLELTLTYNSQELEGAVMQYQVQDGTDGPWITIGDLDRGLNWYNANSISASPGGSITGWTGVAETDEWIEAAFNLGEVQQAAAGNSIKFRVAFASLDLSNRVGDFEGFAFDNVVIRNKDRVVLVEHFTNVTQPQVANERRLINDFSIPKNDVVYIQYHTEEGDDPFYYNDFFPRNTSNDHLTRRFFYGLDGPGYTILNGRLIDTTRFNTGWVDRQYSQESLSSGSFDIDIDLTILNDGALQVNASATRNANPNRLLDEWEGDLTMAMTLALVEKEVDFEGEVLNNVFLQFLPFQGGIVRSGQWRTGGEATLEMQETWSPHRDAESGEFGIVAMVQLVHGVEENVFGYPTTEVFQADERLIDLPLLQSAVTGLEDALSGGIRLFPNPVGDKLSISFGEGALQEPLDWSISNVQGQLIASGQFPTGDAEGIINVQAYEQGVYLMRLWREDSQYLHRITIVR